MDKIYLEKNVYEATQERLKTVFEEFDNIYVSFSGGKDSGLLLNLCIDYMKKNNITKKLGVFHQDFEAQYEKTTEYVTKMFELHSSLLFLLIHLLRRIYRILALIFRLSLLFLLLT